jgi:serine/threonine-protein kinase
LRGIRSSPIAAQALTELVADRICSPDSIHSLGRFRVEEIIGRGGSGRVFRARHPLLGIPVALKMLSHALALSSGGPEAFVAEASLLAQLDHPGIVRVLDVFEAQDTFVMVMPWLQGTTLRESLDREAAFDTARVVSIAADALDALATLHNAHLVHRDIKPSNLFLRADGRLLLIDFGISCTEGTRPTDQCLVGSPTYCSPEQILGRPIDARADVYSLACTLYEVLFGHPPFEAEDIDGVLTGHIRGTPRFDGTPRTECSPALLAWLRRCLSRTRQQRPTAREALAALRALE